MDHLCREIVLQVNLTLGLLDWEETLLHRWLRQHMQLTLWVLWLIGKKKKEKLTKKSPILTCLPSSTPRAIKTKMRQEVTHRWGVTASSLKRSSLSTGGWVGGKLTSPAPIYDITLYLIKGSESALNSSLISERYRKEIVRERAREILCRSVERGERERVLKELCLAKDTGPPPRWVTPLAGGSSHSFPQHRPCWFKTGTFLGPFDDNQRGQKALSQLNADWHQIGHEFGQ